MSDTVTFTGSLVVLECWCGMHHAVPSGLRDYQLRQHDDGKAVPDIFCPLGHAHIPSGEPKAKRLERQLANRDEDLRAERAAHAATKGQLTKARKRAAAGVCPCCQRSFVNVRRHMQTKHPDELAALET